MCLSVSQARTSFLLSLLMACTAHAALPVDLEEKHRIEYPDGVWSFEGPLALSGDTLLVGSVRLEITDEPEFQADYRVHVFERSPDTDEWAHRQVLTEFSVVDDWRHPLHLAIEGNVAVVATFGHAHVYERSSGGWALKGSLERPPGYEFGSGAAITAEHILLGGESATRLAGLFYSRNSAGDWVFEQAFLGTRTNSGDGFYGAPIALADDFAIVGHIGIPLPGYPLSGFLYQHLPDGSWMHYGFVPGEGQIVVHENVFAARTREYPDLGPEIYVRNDLLVHEGRIEVLHPWASLDMTRDASGRRLIAIGVPRTDHIRRHEGYALVFAHEPTRDPPYTPLAMLRGKHPAPGFGAQMAIDGNRVAVVTRDAQSVMIFEVPQDLAPNPPILQDTFEDGSASDWRTTSTSWSVAQGPGSRVYRQTVAGGDRRAILSSVDWTNQSIEADVRILNRDTSGTTNFTAIMARYTDDANYYYVRLRGRDRFDLVKRVGGVEQVIQSNRIPVSTNTSYRVRLEAVGTRLRAYLNGRLHHIASDSDLSRGSVGLRTYWTRAEYDNVVVSPNETLRLTDADAEDENLNVWTLQSPENWTFLRTETGAVLRQNVALGGVRAIAGTDFDHTPHTAQLADHVVTVRVRPLSFIPTADPWVGVIARYRDDANYIYVTFNRNGYISLRKLVNGVIHVFDTAPSSLQTGTWYTLRLEAIGSHLRVYLDGVPVLEGIDNALPDPAYARSRYGLMTSRASAEFDDFVAVHP